MPVIDAKMPRLCGKSMLEYLSEDKTEIPLIVITGSDDADTRKLARQAGATAYFRKPVDADALLDAIRWAVCRKK